MMGPRYRFTPLRAASCTWASTSSMRHRTKWTGGPLGATGAGERDDGDRAWTVDYINYMFEIPCGYVFTGVNEASSSQTERLIGSMDASGNYGAARVEYVSSRPEWHRLKGWGYDGLGPPGPLPWLVLRMSLVIGLVVFAYLCAYALIRQSGSAKSSA